jgi:signal transduction histidine kinase
MIRPTTQLAPPETAYSAPRPAFPPSAATATAPAVVTPLRRSERPPRFADELIVAVATADDMVAGLARVVPMLRRAGRATRVEWWRPDAGGSSMRLESADGSGHGRRTAFSLGPAGALVVAGDAPGLASALDRVVPFIRRRWTEEQLANHATAVIRQNEALEDFAAFVAHDLKGPLHAVLRGGDPEAEAARALEVVDSVLAAVRTETAGASTTTDCLDEAVRDLGATEVRVVVDPSPVLPVSPGALRLVLRNLLANAVAAGASQIRISGLESGGASTLTVDDDGAGLDAPEAYRGGSGIGLKLCERLLARCGGELSLEPRPSGGTRASLVFRR